MTTDDPERTQDFGRWTMDEEQPTTGNWGLIGHEWAVQMLVQHLRHDSVRHAYLFSGPSGLGRRTLALRLAQALNCPQPVAPGQACGKCKTCQQIERMQYADLAVIQAEKEGSTLKVEQIRSVRQSLVLKPYQGKYRVALFLRFQEASDSAQNALLKTLEEAPAHVILILTADTPEQLLPTIVSRCEVLRLRALPVETVEASLRERGADETTARLLAHISGGRPGYALRLMDDKETMKVRAQRLEDLQSLLRSSRRARFAYAEKLTERKKKEAVSEERFRETLLIWLSFWRDVMLKASGTNAPLTNVDCLAEIEALAGKLSLDDARRLVQAAEGTIDKLERNVNARLLAEVLLLDWPKM
jgi:DNA polymerase-3 subunit delta'